MSKQSIDVMFSRRLPAELVTRLKNVVDKSKAMKTDFLTNEGVGKMKITKQNSTQAAGYADENIRECPRCYGDGTRMGNTTGGEAHEMECDVCHGTGIVTLSPQRYDAVMTDIETSDEAQP